MTDSLSITFIGDVPRVDGQLAVARAFGDKSLKRHLSSEPDVKTVGIDDDVDFIILASDGLWKVSCSMFTLLSCFILTIQLCANQSL